MASFNCKQCGVCCRWPGYVYLTEPDMRRLAGHWNISVQLLIDRHTRLAPNRAQLCLTADQAGACCFLKENKCVCYDARPDQCRQYPSLWAPPEGCPGFSGGPEHTKQERIQWN